MSSRAIAVEPTGRACGHRRMPVVIVLLCRAYLGGRGGLRRPRAAPSRPCRPRPSICRRRSNRLRPLSGPAPTSRPRCAVARDLRGADRAGRPASWSRPAPSRSRPCSACSSGYLGGAGRFAIMRWVDFMFALPGPLVAIVVVGVARRRLLDRRRRADRPVHRARHPHRAQRGARAARRCPTSRRRARSASRSRGSCSSTSARTSCRSSSPMSRSTSPSRWSISPASSFLGLGVEPGHAGLGPHAVREPQYPVLQPGRATAARAPIMLTAVSMNLIGDWVFERFAQVTQARVDRAGGEKSAAPGRAGALDLGRIGVVPIVTPGSISIVARGETVGIVGESGSGKSLTARAIAGLLPPGVHARGDRPARRDLPDAARRARAPQVRGLRASRCCCRTRSRC